VIKDVSHDGGGGRKNGAPALIERETAEEREKVRKQKRLKWYT